MEQVARAGDLVAQKTDQAANKTLNNLKAWEAYQRTTDATFRAVDRFDKVFRQLSTSFDQKRMSPARYAEELQKLTKELDAAGIPRNFGTMNFEAVRKEAQETLARRQQIIETFEEEARLRQTMRDANPPDLHVQAYKENLAAQKAITAEMQRQRDLMRQANPPTSHVEAFRAQQAQQAEQTRIRDVYRQANPQNAHIEAFRAQQAAQKADQERFNQLQGRANEYLERAFPLRQALARQAKEELDIQEMLTRQILTQEEANAARADAAHRVEVIRSAQTAGGGRLNRADLTNLSYQANDAITMLASGSSVMQVFATQGGQVYQTLAGARGGLVEGFKSLGGAIRGVMTPAVTIGSMIAGSALTAALAWNAFDKSIRNVERSLIGLGASTPATLGQLNELSKGIAERGGGGVAAAREGVSQYASTGRIDPDLYEDAYDAGKDYAVLVGTEAVEAHKALADALADPARGVLDLDKKFNAFNNTQVTTIQRLAASGDLFGAQKLILEGLIPTIQKASDTTSGWARIWGQVSKVGGDAIQFLGEDLDALFNGERPERIIARLNHQRETAVKRRATTASDPLLDEYNKPAALAGFDAQIAEIDKKIEAMREKAATAGTSIDEQMAAAARNLSKDLAGLTQDWDPLQKQVDDFNDKIEALQRILDDPLSIRLNTAELEKAQEAIDFNRRAGAQAQRYQAAGGQAEYEGVRSSRDALDNALLDETSRAIQEINQQWRDNVEAARASKKTAEELANAERSLGEIRDSQVDALQRSTALGVARSVLPEMFEQDNLENQLRDFQAKTPAQLGMSAEGAAAVVQRLEERIRNLKTPMQEAIQQYELEQRSITATTFEQTARIEKDKAYIAALAAGRSELEAAALAQLAYNNAVAQAQRAAYDAVRSAQDQAAMVGKTPYEREQEGISQNYRRQREQYGNQPGFDDAEKLERWTAQQEAIRGPIADATRSLNEQIEAARIQAETFGQSTAAIESAKEALRLRNEYERQGIPITREMNQAIAEQSQRYGEAKQTIAQMQEVQDNLKSYKDMGQDALKGFFSDIRQGKSLVDSLASAFEKLADKIFDMMLNSMFDPNSQGGFNIFSLLFGGGGQQIKLPSLTSVGAATQGIATQAPSVTAVAPQPIAADIATSIVPAFKSAIPKAVEVATSSATGALASSFKNTDFLSLVRKAEGTAGPNGFNTSLAHGKFLPGGREHNLTGMTMAQIDQLQTGMLNHPANSYNSSALGAFQIVRTTRRGLQKELGIGNDELFNEENQTRMAEALMKRRGNDVAGLRNEWEGLRRVDGDTIRQTYGNTVGGGRQIVGGGGANALGGGSGLDSLATNAQSASDSLAQMGPNLNEFGTGIQGAAASIQNAGPQLQQGLQQVTNTVGQGGTGVGTALQNTTNVIGQGAQGIGGAVNQLASALTSGGGGGGGGIGGFFSSLFGGGGGGGGGGYSSGIDFGYWDNVSWMMHSGGTVGANGVPQKMTLMDQIMAMSAPSHHRGTLKPDERFAKLQNGEEVISKDDVQNARRNGNAQRQGGATVVKPVVNVIGAQSTPEVRENEEGGVDIIFEQMEAWQANRAKRGKGPLTKAMNANRNNSNLIG